MHQPLHGYFEPCVACHIASVHTAQDVQDGCAHDNPV